MPSLNGAVVLVTGANGGIGTHFVHQYEVIADELTAQVKAALSGPVEALYPELRGTGAALVTVEE